MNKKLIAIAIATAMTAPVAMADVKVSGRVGGHLTVYSHDNAANDWTGFSDAGQTRLQFDATAGDAFARIALDERLGRDNATATSYKRTKRDNYIGYNFGNMSAAFGRMAGVAKNIEKDPYIATFLQSRGTIAEPLAGGAQYGSSSFIDHVITFKMKAGAANVAIQYDVGDQSAGSPNEGHTGIAVTGKGGPVDYFFAYNNGTASGQSGSTPNNDESNMKLGASMKFGKVKATLVYQSADNNGAGQSAITVRGNFGLGDGLSMNGAVGLRSGDTAADDATWLRVAVMKKLNANASAYAGYTSTTYDAAGNDNNTLGGGMIVKF